MRVTIEKTALESSINIAVTEKLPQTVTFSIEDRYYNFGSGRPFSDSSDKMIYVLGLETHFGEILF